MCFAGTRWQQHPGRCDQTETPEKRDNRPKAVETVFE